MSLSRTSLIIQAAQWEHNVAHPPGMVLTAPKPHPQPEMIVHADQAGIARSEFFDQLAEARHNAVSSRKLQLRSISSIRVSEAPRTIFEKCRMYGLAKHMFHRAGSSMLGTVFPCQI